MEGEDWVWEGQEGEEEEPKVTDTIDISDDEDTNAKPDAPEEFSKTEPSPIVLPAITSPVAKVNDLGVPTNPKLNPFIDIEVLDSRKQTVPHRRCSALPAFV